MEVIVFVIIVVLAMIFVSIWGASKGLKKTNEFIGTMRRCPHCKGMAFKNATKCRSCGSLSEE